MATKVGSRFARMAGIPRQTDYAGGAPEEKSTGPKFKVGDLVENTWGGGGMPSYVAGKVTEVSKVTSSSRRDAFGNRSGGGTLFRYKVTFITGASGWCDEDTLEPSQGGVQRSFCGFLKAICKGDQATLEKTYGAERQTCKTAGVTKAAMGEESGTAGGYLVPQDFTLALMRTFAEDSFIYPRANVLPMNSAETLCPMIDGQTVPSAAGTSPFFGGLLFKWGSSQAPLETEPKFRQMSLKSWDLLGYATVSNQWLMDAGPEGDARLIDVLGKAAAWYAEYAFLQGAGSSLLMPLGILNCPALKTATRSSGNHVTATDIGLMASYLLPFSWRNAIWATNPTTLADITKLSTFQINHTTGDEIVSGSDSCGSLLTRPLFVTEKLPAMGTQGDLILFDPTLYTIGDRMRVLVDVGPEAPGFRNFQTDFRVWLRLDGKPTLSTTITLQDAATVVSAYVALK